MGWRLIGYAVPYSKAFNKVRKFTKNDDKWPKLHDIFLRMNGIEVNLNEQRTGLSKPEFIGENPVVLKMDDIAVAFRGFNLYYVYKKEDDGNVA